MAEILPIIFKEGGKVYYFAPGKGEYKVGDGVIVETARGVEYAKVAAPVSEVDDSKLKLPLKPVLREATPRDEENYRRNKDRRDEAIKLAKSKISDFGLDMKLIDCEFAFDGSKATFYFSAPDRVDFRDLVRELSAVYHMRIEMRQVGIRDEIKLLGGLAPCGRECCCSSYMSDIGKVSIKMAKYQGLSLNPTKISGLCGRLMCCLAYENEYYSEAYKQMPKIGSEISTPDGTGFVVNVNMLKMLVRVRIEDKTRDAVTFKDFSVDELNGSPRKVATPPVDEENADEVDDVEVIRDEEREGGARRQRNDGSDNRQNRDGRNDDRRERQNRDGQNRDNGNRDNRQNRDKHGNRRDGGENNENRQFGDDRRGNRQDRNKNRGGENKGNRENRENRENRPPRPQQQREGENNRQGGQKFRKNFNRGGNGGAQ